jgi:hypothetical protein
MSLAAARASFSRTAAIRYGSVKWNTFTLATPACVTLVGTVDPSVDHKLGDITSAGYGAEMRRKALLGRGGLGQLFA